jgi:arylsulfatase A-like enzyme
VYRLLLAVLVAALLSGLPGCELDKSRLRPGLGYIALSQGDSERGNVALGPLWVSYEPLPEPGPSESMEPGRRYTSRRAPTHAIHVTNRSGDVVASCLRILGTSERPLSRSAVIGSGLLAPGAEVRFEARISGESDRWHRVAWRSDGADRRSRHRGLGTPSPWLGILWQHVDGDTCPSTPNVVFILVDDMGYGDLSSYSDEGIPTPNIDRLADEGIRLDAFYGEATCTPARAALLTGSYGKRVSMPTGYRPTSIGGLHPDEITIAELLAARGYATGMMGKWHLGRLPQHLPLAQGFDSFFGIPYSHDLDREARQSYPPLPLYEGDQVVELGPDKSQLTRRFTERAVSFIEEQAGAPFFLYLAHPMPHVPLAASERFRGTSGFGLYGDVVTELDWSVGEVLDALERMDIDEETLVVFASDNGPWLRFGNHSGRATPLREGKGTTFEGGVRVPGLARWPGTIPAGLVSEEPIGLIDILPTLADLTASLLPDDRILDGRSVAPILLGRPGAMNSRASQVMYVANQLRSIRVGRYKLHLPHFYGSVGRMGRNGSAGTRVWKYTFLSLYDVIDDPGELFDLSSFYPDVVELLLAEVDRIRLDLGDAVTNTAPGPGVRAPGVL